MVALGSKMIDAPVVGVPVSTGYGAAFGGVTALLSMLNSCASETSMKSFSPVTGLVAQQASGAAEASRMRLVRIILKL